MKILTLCGKCRLLYESSSYSLKPYAYDRTTTQPEEKCSHCRKKRTGMEMYIVDTKKRRT